MNKKAITLWPLCLINIVAIVNLRSLPVMAKLGWHALIFYAIAAIGFLIPSALCCAELSSNYKDNGGIYSWVRHGLGEIPGLLSIWLEWINNLIALPTTLATIVATLFIFHFNQISTQPGLLFISMIAILWFICAVNLLGISFSARFSAIGAIIGTFIPAAILIFGALSMLYHHPHIALSHLSTAPKQILSTGQSALLVSAISSFSGIQICAFFANDVHDPKRTLIKSIFISAILIFILVAGGALSIATLTPRDDINIINGVIQSFASIIDNHTLHGLMALFLGLGMIACANAWFIGPARGIMRMAEYYPALFSLKKCNQAQAPKNILLIQAILVSLLCLAFMAKAQLSTIFWLLIALTSQFTALMYVLVFTSFIVLRIKNTHKHTPHFKIPGPTLIAYGVASLGIITNLFAYTLAWHSPSTILDINSWQYHALLTLGNGLIMGIPVLLFCVFCKKTKNSSQLS